METNNTITDVNTSVEKVDLDIDSWLGAPGADSIIVPESTPSTDEKPNIFSSAKTDVSFLDEENVKSDEIKTVLEEIIDDPADDEGGLDEPKGRPRTEKSGLVNFLKKRIESKEMFAFDDYDESKQSLDDYLSSLSEKDVDELWQANVSNMKQEVASQTPVEFFESLPEELQYAAKYVADGGQDLKGLFRTLAHVEEIVELDPTNEYDQEEIARQYLYATNFGTPEEIEAEINDWRDLDKLGQKANQFKPKLDAMQEQIIAKQLAEQEQKKAQQEKAARVYTDNVYNTLVTGEVGGIKLDKKTQSLLYSGLVQPNYPSISGRPTNLLGHLLEKYQFVEPRHDLIAEALWLLADPNGYKNKVREIGSREAVQRTVKQLKTEEGRKLVNSSNDYKEDDRRTTSTKPQKTISRANMFKRF